MRTRESLHNRVYKDILSQIYEGVLPYKSILPTIYTLRKTYGVSDNCIRAALGQLRKNGYISTARGRAAQVVFDVNAPDVKNELPSVFACDKKNLYAFYDAIEILFPSLYTFAALTCTQEQLDTLAEIVAALPRTGESCERYIELNIQFHKTVFASMENKLIAHVVATVMQNTLLPATLLLRQSVSLGDDFLLAATAMRNVYAAILQKDREATKQCWRLLIGITEDTAKKVVEDCRDIPETGDGKYAGLQYAHEFKYLLIAHDLYQRILEGEFAVGDYLPAIEQSRHAYQAGTVTVRRAYRVLGESGLTGTENGRGTRVVSLTLRDGSPFDARSGSVTRTSYLEALDFLRIVCGDLLRSGIVFSSIKTMLEGPLNPSHRYSIIILCKEIMRGAATPAIYTLYQSISPFLFWGIHREKAPGGKLSTAEKHLSCVEIVNLIEQGQTEQAIHQMRELLTRLASSEE